MAAGPGAAANRRIGESAHQYFGLSLGDALIGAAWLVLKSEGDLRERCYREIPRLLAGTVAILGWALLIALNTQLRVLDRWTGRPWIVAFPGIGLLAAGILLIGVRDRLDSWPFAASTAIFAAAFATLVASFLPYMVPFSITVAQAAAPASSLAFAFWGAGVVVLPLTLLYTVLVYVVFKGKVESEAA